MTRAQKGQKIIDACLAAQRGGSAIHGIGGPSGMMTWTGMSYGQVWDGLGLAAGLRNAAGGRSDRLPS